MLISTRIPENPTKLIAQINALASQKHDNPFLAARLLETQPKLAPTEALFSYQSNILTNNRYALDLETLKHEGVSRSTKKATTDAQPTTSSSINTLSVFHAAAHTQGKDTAASIKALRALLDNHPLDVGLILSLVQLYVSSNNLAPAVQLLESFFSRLDSSNQDVRYAPGLVALLVTLYKHQGRSAPAAAALNEAAKYWSDKGKQNDELLRAAGLALLESSSKEDLETAAGFFKSLKKGGGEDKLAFAGYVASVATTDIDSVRPHLDQLTSVEDLIAGVDAEALENAGIASLPVTMVDASKKRATATAATQEGLEKPKKKRVRQSQLPKEFVEGKTMDPERWLPLKDRSNYKPKGKKGKGKGREDRTQGGVVREEEQLTLAAGAGVVKVQNAPSKSQKKKKGKK
jgi:signal recognition particle subunit SRP72